MTEHDLGISEAEMQALVDGRLAPRRQTEVLARLGRDPERLRRVAAYAEQTVALRRRVVALEDATADPASERLQRELGAALARRRHRPWLRRAAAAVLLLGAGWSGHALFQSSLAQRLPPVVVEAAQAHHVFAEDRQRPVEFRAAARKEMAAWFSRHLGEPVEIPSLHAVGLRLVGGRLLSGDDGPVAQLIYEDRSGYRLTLCLSGEPAEIGPDFQIAQVDGLTAGYWQDGEITYAVVAETSEQQLAVIATEAGAPAPERVL